MDIIEVENSAKVEGECTEADKSTTFQEVEEEPAIPCGETEESNGMDESSSSEELLHNRDTGKVDESVAPAAVEYKAEDVSMDQDCTDSPDSCSVAGAL